MAQTVTWNMATDYNLQTLGVKQATQLAIEDARDFFELEENDAVDLELFFPTGVYVFDYDTTNPNEVKAAIQIDDFYPGENGSLTVRGAGRLNTFFIVNRNQDPDNVNNQAPYGSGQSQYGIRATNSERITFSQFDLAVSQQTVSQGVVTRADSAGKELDLLIDDGYPDPTDLEPDRTNEHGRFLRRYFDGTYPRIDDGNNSPQEAWSHSVRKPGVPRVFTFHMESGFNFQVGDLIGVKAKHGKDIYRFVDCSDITLLSLRFSGKTRGVFVTSPHSQVINCVALPEWINGKMGCLASPGGGPQFHARAGGGLRKVGQPDVPLGIGALVEDCHFVSLGDDCVGVFEQIRPVIRDCNFRDSFGRGIFQHRCEQPPNCPTCPEVLVQFTNLIRCIHLIDDTLH